LISGNPSFDSKAGVPDAAAFAGVVTTHLVLEPLDLVARLATLVPPPRRHPTRCHGAFAPHRKLRAAEMPARRGKGGKNRAEGANPCATPHHLAMSSAQRLRRVFGIEIEGCARCETASSSWTYRATSPTSPRSTSQRSCSNR